MMITHTIQTLSEAFIIIRIIDILLLSRHLHTWLEVSQSEVIIITFIEFHLSRARHAYDAVMQRRHTHDVCCMCLYLQAITNTQLRSVLKITTQNVLSLQIAYVQFQRNLRFIPWGQFPPYPPTSHHHPDSSSLSTKLCLSRVQQ